MSVTYILWKEAAEKIVEKAFRRFAEAHRRNCHALHDVRLAVRTLERSRNRKVGIRMSAGG